MARPKLEIDEKQVEALASIGCTVSEIAAVMGVSKRTLETRFCALIEKGREKLCASIKRTQYAVGVNDKNPTMLIWLGKQHCDQRDKREQGTPEEYARKTDDELRRIIAGEAYTGESLDEGTAVSR